VFHAQLTTGSSIVQSDINSWTASFASQYKTSFAPRQTADVQYVLTKCVLYAPGGGELIGTSAMTGAGTSGGTMVGSLSACKNISWLSTVYWRGGKPRTYISGVSNSEASGDFELIGGEITALTTAATGFRTAINALAPGTITGTTLGFVSFSSGKVPRVPSVFFPFTGAVVHPRLGTQRRRLGKWMT
jgi:hypothetical protein